MAFRSFVPLLVWVLLQCQTMPSYGQWERPFEQSLPRRPICTRAAPASCTDQITFRTADGSCNNLNNPLWGSSTIPFVRLLPPVYGPNEAPRGEDASGVSSLPTPRQVSAAVKSVPPEPRDDGVTLMLMQWGQFIDHDFTFTPEEEVEDCCVDQSTYVPSAPSSACRSLDVRNDSFYEQHGIECLPFSRSTPADISCDPDQTREQMNLLTSYLDASNVYGSTQMRQNQLREMADGRMRVRVSSPIDEGTTARRCSFQQPFHFLPIQSNATPNSFFAGDVRVEEQPGLTSMHTLFLRVHNKLADQFKQLYPDQTDEAIFQVTRKIVSALLQRITYGEFLPVVLGQPAMQAWKLELLPIGGPPPTSFYDENVDATLPNVIATAAFRFGHSLISNLFMLRTTDVRLADSFANHFVTLQAGQYPSDFLEALGFNVAESMDHSLVEDLVNRLFAQNAQSPGTDLMARNVQRGRDHGLPSYTEWRKVCGLPDFSSSTFTELRNANIMNPELVDKFASLYSSPEDIDVFPAVIAEFPEGTGIVGPTLTCLLGKFFSNLKIGDRFWFENIGQFTQIQLQAIQRTTLAALICDNTPVRGLPFEVMRLPHPNCNAVRNCCDIMQGTVIQDLERLNFF